MNTRKNMYPFVFLVFFMILSPPFIGAQGVDAPKWDAADIMKNAINNQENYSKGYTEPGYENPNYANDGFIGGVILATGIVKQDTDSTEGLNTIKAFDIAEISDTRLGELNMVTASSFNGIRGVYAGYDFAVPPDIQKNVGSITDGYSGKTIPLYRLKAIQDATRNVIGSNNDRRFSYLPGAFVTAAMKYGCWSYEDAITEAKKFPHYSGSNTNLYIWSSLAIGIADGRKQESTDTGSSIYVEDNGAVYAIDEDHMAIQLNKLMIKMAETVSACGADQKTAYNAIYVGWKATKISNGEFGCALTVGPYLTLPKNAPKGMAKSTQDQWLKSTGNHNVVLQPTQANTYNGPTEKVDGVPAGYWLSGKFKDVK